MRSDEGQSILYYADIRWNTIYFWRGASKKRREKKREWQMARQARLAMADGKSKVLLTYLSLEVAKQNFTVNREDKHIE